MMRFSNNIHSSKGWILIDERSNFKDDHLTDIARSKLDNLIRSDAAFLEYVSRFIHLLAC